MDRFTFHDGTRFEELKTLGMTADDELNNAGMTDLCTAVPTSFAFHEKGRRIPATRYFVDAVDSKKYVTARGT